MSILETVVNQQFNSGELSRSYHTEEEPRLTELKQIIRISCAAEIEEYEELMTSSTGKIMEQAYKQGLKDALEFIIDTKRI